MSQQVHYFVSMPFYPKNNVQPWCRTRSKPNLNIIFVLIIVTDAQVFETIKKYGGQGYLAAPYCLEDGDTKIHVIIYDSNLLCCFGKSVLQGYCRNNAKRFIFWLTLMGRWVYLTFSQDTVGNWEFLCKENYLNNLIDPDVQKRLMENLINYTHDNNLEDVSFKPLKAKLFNGIIMVINVC